MLNLPKFNQVAFAFATTLAPDPAPGDPFEFVCPQNMILSPISVNLHFTASAAAANRYIGLTITTNIFPVFTFASPFPIVAGQTFSVTASTSPISVATPTPSFTLHIPFPPNVFLYNPDRFAIYAFGMDAADQISFIYFHHKFWPI